MVGSTGKYMASFNSEFIGLDLEATDLSPERGGIIEVGAVRWKNGKEVEAFSTLVDPGHPIPPIITSITGIRGQDVLGKPSFAKIKDELAAFIGDAPIIGHNIAFDIGFLGSQGLPLKNPLFDTWKIATLMLPKASSHSLEALAQDLKLNHPEAHRALHDARVGAELFMYLADRVQELDPRMVAQLQRVVARNKGYSLAAFFDEVLGSAKVGKAKGGTAAAAVKLTPGWKAHTSHVGERMATAISGAKIDTRNTGDFSKLFKEAVSPIVPAFELRPQQVKLAQLVSTKMGQTKGAATTLLEAATGLGRREGALVGLLASTTKTPAVYAVSSQHQLETIQPAAERITTFFGKSLAVLDQPENYVFVPALEHVLERTDLSESQVHLAIKLLIWIQTTTTGLLKEVAITWEERSLMDEISCAGHTCTTKPEPDLCSFCRAVAKATDSDVVLMRHATLFWLSTKGKGLIAIKSLLIDDVDQLENSTIKFFGVLVRQSTLERLLQRVAQELPDLDIEPIHNQVTLLAGLMGVFLDHQALEAEWSGYRTISISEVLEKDPEYGRLQATLASLVEKLQELARTLATKKTEQTQTLVRSITELIEQLSLFTKSVQQNGVVTLSLNAEQELVLKFEPVSAVGYVKEHVLNVQPLVLIGPRLTVEQKFDFIQRRLGLPKVEALMVQTTDTLQDRAKIITLTDHPESIERAWVKATAHVIATTAQTVHGRVLVLFGGRGQVLNVHPEVEKLLARSKIKLIAQGLSGGRGKTTKALARHTQAVLLSSHFFMQGRTFAHGFRAIIVVKLPFEVPDEAYKLKRAKESDAGFMTLDLPRVALKIREQFDRLLVGPRDRGVLLVIDPKINKGYGEVVLKSLPSVPQAVIKTGDLPSELAPFAEPVDKAKA
ncbi:MAG: exonuclease domain-containing protein [Candidatus Andersenbacteria bacterium]